MKNIFYLFIFTLNILCFSGQIAAASTGESCSGIFSSSSDFIQNLPQGELITKTLPSISPRLWQRYWNHPDVDFIFHKILLDQKGNTNTIDLPNGDWIIARSMLIENHLFLDLVHIQHKVNSTSIRVGGRSEGANSLLLKTLTAYAKTVHHHLIHSGITDAYIRGVNIKNPMLKDFLTENGFYRNDLHRYSVEMEKHLQF